MAAIESVDIITIANVLGEANLNLVSLGTSNKINMWSKFKPVEHNSLDELTETQWKLAGYGIIATTVDLQYPSGANNATIFQQAENGSYGWSYETVNYHTYPLRMTDFRGYNHACINPFYMEAVVTNVKAQVYIGCTAKNALPANNITAEDLTRMGGLDSMQRVGYGLLYKKNGSVIMMNAVDDNGEPLYPIVDSNGNMVNYSIEISSDNGVYEVAAYLVSTYQSLYYLLPVEVVTCNVYAIKKISSINLTIDTSAAKIKISYTVTGNSSYLRSNTIPAGEMYLRIYKNSTDKVPDIIQTVNIGQLSSSTPSYSGTVTGIEASLEDYSYAVASYLDCTGSVEW